MNVNLLEQATLIHKAIYTQGLLNVTRTNQIKALSSNLCELFEKTSQSILKESKSFFRTLKDDRRENDGILFLNQFVGDMVKQIANLMSSVGRQIKASVVDPLIDFVVNLQQTNLKISQDSLQYINTIETNTSLLRDIDRSYRELQNKLKLTKQKSAEMQEQETLYREQVSTANEVWGQLQAKYKKLLNEFDMSNQSRCVFTKNVEIRLVRILNQIVNSDKMETTLKEYEAFPYVHNDFEDSLVQKIEEACGHSQLLRDRVVECELPVFDLEAQAEIFHKKKRKDIEDFAEFFISQSTKPSKQYEDVRSLIIDDNKWTEYFISSLSSRLFTEVNLPLEKYNDLLALMKYLFAEAFDSGKYPTLYSLLWIAMRIHHNGQYLIRHFNKYDDFLNDQRIWFQMLEYLKKEAIRKDRSVGAYIKNLKKLYSRGIINRGLKRLGINKYTVDDKQFKDEQQQLNYDALRQLNTLIAKLEMDSEQTMKLLLGLCKKCGLSKGNMEKLIKYQYMSTRNELKTYFNARTIKKLKDQKFMGYSTDDKKIKVVKMCLMFLPLGPELFKLRLVCKSWSKSLFIPIYKRYLKYQPDLQKIAPVRLKLYSNVIIKVIPADLFEKMINEMGADQQFLEVINLDVKRSLNSRPELQPMLKDILQVFAYYNDQIGYVQGMNYQGQHILKLTNKANVAYSILEYMLSHYYQTIFGQDFDGLKLKMYQFSRVLEHYLPNLANHFQDEKIQGEHYLVSWAITLWGEFSGDIVWILWDGFITDGWKWWIKTCLWVLTVFQAEFLSLRFEDILKSFSESGSNEFFNCRFRQLANLGLNPTKIKQEINSVQVTDALLKQIEKEYEYSIKKFNEFMASAN